MINLFNIPSCIINTADYSNVLHGQLVRDLESKIAAFVGCKHAVSFNSATNAIFLALLNKNTVLKVPSLLPPVVLNAIITSGNDYDFVDDISWVGNSYVLADFGDYKIVDSAQKLEKNQFIKECNNDDLMIFSFYPTKPLSGCDGGMIVSNDKDKIDYLREMTLNGMGFAENNWEREMKHVGYKMYMNTIQADVILRNFKNYELKIQAVSKIREHYNNSLGSNNQSNHLYTIDIFGRDGFIEHMKSNNVVCGIHYKSLHNHPLYSKNQKWNLPLSDEKSEVTMSIPMHERMALSDAEKIISEIKKISSIHKTCFGY